MAEKHEPARMCVICRQRFSRNALSRFVAASGDAARTGNGLEADPKRVKPGRGWYVCDSPECVAKFSERRFKRRSHRENGNGQR
ncbi:MAG: DUF448 domain-containing protein [Mailhella sp.]|nr:DUF448 domain-containing protein [Mailhella sp.]